MPDLSDAIAAILVGGMGTRLRSVVADRPKVLALVHGRPFLSYLLDQVATAGLRDVVLCTGYLGERVEAEFGSAYRGLRLTYSQEATPLGTAGALRLALPFFKSDTVLALNGDSFCEADLAAFSAWHCDHAAVATLFLTHVPDTARYGNVRLGPEGQILDFVEKDEAGGPGWINAGIYLLRRQMLQTIPAGQAVSIERETFPAWIGRGLCGYQGDGPFLDIGTPGSYRKAEEFLARFSVAPHS
jgi:NDP-sugar pyrophosphorylase family protein